MISDDTIISEGNVAYVAGSASSSKHSANLATIARLFDKTKNSLYLDKPISVKNLKYFTEKNKKVYDKYTQLEYVEADGNQYINTNYYPNQDTEIEMYCWITSTTSSPIFGARSTLNGSQSYILWKIDNDYRFDYKSNKTTISEIVSSGRRYHSFRNMALTIDQKTYTYNKTSFSVPNALYIFGLMENAGLDDRHPSGKIYYCRLYSSANEMVRYFIPAKRNSDGVIGLLDILDATFYESEGEPWIAGPEVGTMPNFALNGYDILDYAQSSTETYVDTEFSPNQNSRTVMEMQKVANSSTIAQYIFCSRYYAMPEYGILKPANANRWRDGYARERTYLANGVDGASITQRLIIDKNKNVTYIGHGTVNHTYTNFATPNSMALYGCFEDGDGSIDHDIDMRLYWCRIYDNGTLIRNYYPVKRQSDDKVGLYDFVNEKFVLPIKGTLTAGSVIPINF